jgi:hypothetical protein
MSSGGGGRASGKSAVLSGRRTMHMPAVGGGGPAGSTQRLNLPTRPVPSAGRAIPAPALPPPLPRVNVEPPAAQSTIGNGLKMTLLQATALLGSEAFKRLATCEEGSEETASLERLMSLLQQVRQI